MVPIIFGFTLCLSTSLLLGLYVLFSRPYTVVNRITFTLCLSLAVSFAFAMLLHASRKETDAYFWYIAATICHIAFLYLVFSFVAVLTRPARMKPILILSPLPLVLFIVFGLLQNRLLTLTYADERWIVHTVHLPLMVSFFQCFIILYLGASLVLLVRWRKRTGLVKAKRITRILILTFSLYILLAVAEFLLGNDIIRTARTKIAALGSASLLLLVFGIWYCVIKYRFLVTPQALMCRDLMDSVDDMVVLISPGEEIITMNRQAAVLTGRERTTGGHVRDLVVEYDTIARTLETLHRDKTEKISCRIHLAAKHGGVLIDARISIARDRYSDDMGILLVGRLVKDLETFRQKYAITIAESEIIKQIACGQDTHRISEELGIAYGTLKRHMANIHRKIGINSRVELVNILMEYDFSAEEPAQE